MNHKVLTLIFFFFITATKQEEPVCSTIEEFLLANPQMKTERFFEARKTNFVNNLKYMIRTSNHLGSGGYGAVYQPEEFPHMVIKKVEMKKDIRESFYLREMRLLRSICLHEETEYSKISPCRSETIAAFHTCVISFDTIYLFQEKLPWDLSKREVKDAYRELHHFERARIMLDILDKFIELHKLGIVHSDIKPSNIMMRNDDFTDFRIIDLGMADFETNLFNGSTPGYRPPERYKPDHKKIGLSFTEDVFALGMTFAEMEGNFVASHRKIKDGCFSKEPEETCETAITEGLAAAFAKKKGLVSFVSVIKKAVSMNPLDRFDSMETFSIELLKRLTTLKGVRSFILNIANPKKLKDIKRKSTSFWRTQLASMLQAPKKSSGGFFHWIGTLFSCTSKKTCKKTKIVPVEIQINNNLNEKVDMDAKMQELATKQILAAEKKQEIKILL